MKYRSNPRKPLRILSSVFACLYALTIILQPVVVHAEINAPDYINSNTFKQLNNIYFYEKDILCMPGTQNNEVPSAATPGAPADTGSSTGSAVYNFLIGKGLTPVQALGILGNLMQESGGGTLDLKTTALGYDGTGSYGIAQWLGSRKDNLQKFAASSGRDMSDINVQMEFLWSELNGSYKKNTLDPLMQTNNLTEAVSIVLKKFERPKDMSDREVNRRLGFAQSAASQLGVDLDSAGATQPSSNVAAGPSSNVVDCTPANNENGGSSGGGSGGGSTQTPTGENGRLDMSQLARVTIPCEGSWSEPYLTVEASAALTQLNAAFKQHFGRDMFGVSCYRSYEKQVEAKAYWTAQGKPGNAATPGTSNHGWGLAIDLRASPSQAMTYGSGEYKWLMQNAGTYGYCNPKSMQQGGGGPDEPWHWQYKTGC